jgi:hypothetical protein
MKKYSGAESCAYKDTSGRMQSVIGPTGNQKFQMIEEKGSTI